MTLDGLISKLRGDGSGKDDDQEDEVQTDDELVSRPFNPDVDAIPPLLMKGLESAAARGMAQAHYAFALILAPSRDRQNAVNPYWYNQRVAGRELVGIQVEWADQHAQQLAAAKRYEHHLRAAAELGNGYALLDLADHFGDTSFFDGAYDGGDEDRIRISQIAERGGRTDAARKWLVIAAEQGDLDAIAQLIQEDQTSDLQQRWTWLYLGQFYGTDLSKDRHYAIHENGSPYDDDVGGPAFVAGEDGIRLEPLDSA